MLGVDKIYKVALCEGRHEIPDATDGFIFSSDDTVDPTDISHLNDAALSWVNSLDGDDVIVDIYVTGLTVALVAVLNTVNWINSTSPRTIQVNCWHYDCNTNSYYGQPVVDM